MDTLSGLDLRDFEYRSSFPDLDETSDADLDDEETHENVTPERFEAIVRERNDLKSRCRELSAELASTKSLLAKKTFQKTKDKVGVVSGRQTGHEVEATDGKDSAVKHLEEQLSFLVAELTSRVRVSREKDNEMENLHEMIEQRDRKVGELRQKIESLQADTDDLREKMNEVASQRDKLKQEREEVLSVLQNCVTLGVEMEEVVTHVNDLMRVLWDNFAKMETIDVQVLANEKHCTHIENIVRLMDSDRGDFDAKFGCELERKNKALEECLTDKAREMRAMEDKLTRLKGTRNS